MQLFKFIVNEYSRSKHDTENEYQEKKEVESNQVFIINTQDCIIVWWVQYSWHTLQKSKTFGYDNKIDG